MPVKRKEPVALHDGWELHGTVDAVSTDAAGTDSSHVAWRKLINKDTGQEVVVRLDDRFESTATITGVLFTSDEGVSSHDLRQFPIAAIQAAFRERNRSRYYGLRALGAAGFLSPSSHLVQNDDGKTKYRTGPHGRFDYNGPIRHKPRDDKFYALVALQYTHLSAQSDQPTKALSTVNGTSVATAQRWLWEARKREYLPPGKQGRRTKKQDVDGGE